MPQPRRRLIKPKPVPRMLRTARGRPIRRRATRPSGPRIRPGAGPSRRTRLIRPTGATATQGGRVLIRPKRVRTIKARSRLRRPRAVPRGRIPPISPGQRLLKYGINGVKKVRPHGIRVGKAVGRGSWEAAKWSYNKLSKAGAPIVSWGGRLIVDGLDRGGNAVHTIGMGGLEVGLGTAEFAAVRPLEGVARVGTHAADKGVGLLEDLAINTINLGDRVARATPRGIAKGVAYLSRATARRVMAFLADRRAVKGVINPNLRGRWKLVFRPEGIPVTNDGFPIHTIQRTFGRGEKRITVQLNIEMGLDPTGVFRVRAIPVMTGEEAIDQRINRIYQKRWRSAREASHHLLKQLGFSRVLNTFKLMLFASRSLPARACYWLLLLVRCRALLSGRGSSVAVLCGYA